MTTLLLEYKGELNKFGLPKGEFLAYDQYGQRTLPKKDPDTKCNGKIHRQLRYCSKPAGWGTDHAGTGRCKLHGGCCTGRKSGLLRYSDFVPTDLVEKYEEFSVEDPETMKALDDEIGLVRAKIAYLEQHGVSGSNDKMLLNFGELLRRLLESKQKIECGIEKHISIDIAVKLVDQVIQIIDKHVQDRDMKMKIATDMRRLNNSELGLNSLYN